jgi:hypothetical protein
MQINKANEAVTETLRKCLERGVLYPNIAIVISRSAVRGSFAYGISVF